MISEGDNIGEGLIGRRGYETSIFYKWLSGIMGTLFCMGILGIYSTNIKLAKIEIKLEGLQGQFNNIMADRFTGSEGRQMMLRTRENTDKLEQLENDFQDHILEVAKNKSGR